MSDTDESPPLPEQKAERLEEDIEHIRGNLGTLVTELDHRRHRVFDIGARLREHAGVLALGALVIGGLVVGERLIARRSASRARARRGLSKLFNRLAAARAGFVRGSEPTPAPAKPTKASLAVKILVAGLAGAASVAGKRLAQRALADDQYR